MATTFQYSGRPPRGLSPDRKRLRWSDHHHVNFLEGAEVNCLLEHESSSFISMVDESEDPEEPHQVLRGPHRLATPQATPTPTWRKPPCRPLMPGLVSESDSEDELDHEITTLARPRRPPRQVPVVRAGRRNAADDSLPILRQPPILLQKRRRRIPDHIEGVKVYATPCRVDLSPEVVNVSSSTSSHTVSGYEGNDPWSSS
jgi:hypothetical protein